MGYNHDGSYSAVSYDSEVIPSGGYRRRRAVARSWDYADAFCRRWEALERNLAISTTIGTFGYPFGGYDKEQRMDLEEGWRLLEKFQPPSRDYEERLYKAQRQFFVHCEQDNPKLFAELFLKDQDRWMTGLYEHHISELVQLLGNYWPFGSREGLEFHNAYRLLTEHPYRFSESVRKGVAERMLCSRMRWRKGAEALAKLSERPLKRREVLHCFGDLIQFNSPSRRGWSVSDLVKAAYQEANAFGHPGAVRLANKYITHVAHLAGQKAGSISEIDDIERQFGRKLPYAYRKAAADRFRTTNTERLIQGLDGLLASIRSQCRDTLEGINWRCNPRRQ